MPGKAAATGDWRGVQASDLIELRDIGVAEASADDPSPLALSPDRRHIAFLVTRADVASNDYCRALVVLATDGKAAPRIVDRGGEPILASGVYRGLKVDTGAPALITPQWSADGQWIAYQKRVDGVTQLWRVRADGSLAQPVTRSAVDIERWRWASDGRSLIYSSRPSIARVRQLAEEEALRGYLYDERFRPNAGAHPHMREADIPERHFRVDPASGAIGPADRDDENALSLPAVGSPTIVAAADGRQAGAEPETSLPFSPRRLWTADRLGQRTVCRTETCGDIVNLWWARDGSLLFQRREGWAKGRTGIYRWARGQRAPQRILATDGRILGCLSGGDRLFCAAEEAARPRRIVSIDPANGKMATLFDPNPEFGRLALGKVERLTWHNALGLPAWGDLVVPPDYRPGTKLPLVVVQYHSDGFLRGGTGDAHPIFLLAAAGFAVLSIERAPYYGLNDPALQTADQMVAAMTKDWVERRSLHSSLLAGVDQVVARGLVDRDRVGITGLSDGASTAAFALINSDRFRAASISTCCDEPNTVMIYGGTAWADWNHRVRGYPLTTVPDPAFWMPMSLALNASRIDTPILMQLADREYLLGLEAFTALREQGKPVELYVLPDEYHVRIQPRHRLAEYQRDIDWFRFWLQGEEDPSPDKSSQYARWRTLRERRP